MSRRDVVALGAALFGLACAAERGSTPETTARQLPSGFVASVAGDLVSATSVARIAERRGLPPARALDLAVSDALLAREARALTPAGTPAAIERSAVARALLERVAADSAAAGPPTDQELDKIVAERWVELDRPAAVRTTHAIVIVKKPEDEARAHSVAEELARAVAAASTTEDFERLAKAVPTQGAEVRVERLPVITPDGRGFELKEGKYVPRGSFDLAFAKGANALSKPGELSPLVRSPYGFHVLRCEELVPGVSLPKEQRLGLLGPEALTRRAVSARIALLEKLRRETSIETARAVDDLTARVEVAP